MRLLFEAIRNMIPSSEDIMNDREVAEILSPADQYTPDYAILSFRNIRAAIRTI